MSHPQSATLGNARALEEYDLDVPGWTSPEYGGGGFGGGYYGGDDYSGGGGGGDSTPIPPFITDGGEIGAPPINYTQQGVYDPATDTTTFHNGNSTEIWYNTGGYVGTTTVQTPENNYQPVSNEYAPGSPIAVQQQADNASQTPTTTGTTATATTTTAANQQQTPVENQPAAQTSTTPITTVVDDSQLIAGIDNKFLLLGGAAVALLLLTK